MSDPAHVVVSFGECHIELYKHSEGSLCSLGPLLLSVIRNAQLVDYRESSQFHPGGRIIQALISNVTETMEVMKSSKKLRGAIKDDFQFCMGTVGQSWNNGYFLQFYPIEDDSPLQVNAGRWLISYCGNLDGHETLNDWLPSAKKHSLDEFEKFICEMCLLPAANQE